MLDRGEVAGIRKIAKPGFVLALNAQRHTIPKYQGCVFRASGRQTPLIYHWTVPSVFTVRRSEADRRLVPRH